MVQILPSPQPNRVLIHKSTSLRLVIAPQVVMQLRFMVGVLVLQSEGLVSAIRYLGFLFQTTPAGIVDNPNQVAVFIGHLSRSSLSGCRFGRSGSSGFVGDFRRLRWSSCVPVRTSHALCQDWKFHAGYNLLIHLHKHHHSFEKKNLTKTILFHLKPIFPVVL